MSCPNKPGEGLCLTCRLGGLIRCPSLGTPLPLAEAEKPRVRTVWPKPIDYEYVRRVLDAGFRPTYTKKS